MTTTPPKSPPPSEQPKEEIDQIFMDAIIDHYKHVILNEKDLKAAIERLLQRAELEARKEQVMQDFLSLLNDSNEDEAVLIGWRDGQLAELQQELTEMEK